VIATILLLALTVTLFASIFFFVNTFPAPPPQTENQFTSALTYGGSGGTTVVTVSINHLAGPAIPGSDLVYITSAAHPASDPPAFTVSSGIGMATIWTLGQIWTKNIQSYGITVPDNLTVSIVSSSQLIYRAILPGSNPNVPPTFVNLGVTPATPQVGGTLTIATEIIDSNLNVNSVYVNLSELPGVSGTGHYPMTYSATTGLWTYTVAAGVTSGAGTYYVFVNASDNNGLANSAALGVTISAAANAQSTISLYATPSTIVKGSAVTLTAPVTNLGTATATPTVTFAVGGTTVSTQTGPIGAGSTATFSTTWTPSAVGVYVLQVQAQFPGGVTAASVLNVTVFPTILLLAHNVPSGANGPDNTSAWLATELTADGIPFTASFVSCATSLSSSLFTSYAVAIVDFGSTWTGGCAKSASSTDEAAITGATSTSFWVVGSNAFGVGGCSSYSSSFFSLLGAKWTSGSTCMSLPNATGSATYAGSAANGLRADGIPASMTINRTIAGVSTYIPYTYFNLGATPNSAFLTVSAHAVGTWKVGASVRGAALAADPALFTTPLPSGSSWGTGVAGAALVYNVMGFLCGLANASSPARALTDFGVAETALVGMNHGQRTTVYAGIRANGPVGGPVSVTLYVNGTPALFGGVPVVATGTVSANGGYVFVTLVWQAPSSGRFSLSVIVSPLGAVDLYANNNVLGLSVNNPAINFG